MFLKALKSDKPGKKKPCLKHGTFSSPAHTKIFFSLSGLSLFLLFSFSSSATDGVHPCNDEESQACKIWKKRQKMEMDNIAEDRDIEAKRRENQTKREKARLRAEQARAKREKCDKAKDDVKTALDEQKEDTKNLEQKFFDEEEKITDLEKQFSEGKQDLSKNLEDLKTQSNQNLQNLKDDMGQALKGIEQEVTQIENNLSALNEQLDKVEDTRMDAFFARRKQQNEFYSKCFGQALEQTEKERSLFYQRKAAGRLKRKDMGELFSAGKGKTKNQFSARFNSFLHLCLNNQAALLEKENQKNEFKLMMTKLDRQEERIEKKIADLKAKIANLKTNKKAEILKQFKEKMTAELNRFNETYASHSKSFQASSRQTIGEINKVKQRQAHILMQRSQSTPQDARQILLTNQECQGDPFNLFPDGADRGLFNSSPSTEPSGALQ